ncbi:rhodanese-like domain-containing protein [Alphaproteobacteria bacterium]|nr:rhodanese-like domain-containing protein [Alphaproteobacteria bacterium]
MKRLLLTFCVVIILVTTVAVPVNAGETVIMGSGRVLAGVKAGEMTLIDVRSPQEWWKTGVPRGAKAITIHDLNGMSGFVAAAIRAVNGKLNLPLALICARGGRSLRAVNALREAGFTKLINVREGMLGNPIDGPGWLNRKLPVEPCKKC